MADTASALARPGKERMQLERPGVESGAQSEPLTDLAAELAAAEAAEAEAVAEAAEAAARAAELRDAAEGDAKDGEDSPPSRWTRLAPRLGIAAGGLLIGVLTAATGVMLWQHTHVAAQHTRDRAIVDAARNSVTALLTIDHTRAKADVQRILDMSTGGFRDDFAKNADDFIATAEKSKAVTKGTINAAALDSAGPGSGVVLIAATSQVTNVNGAKEDARPFRMSVTVTRDGDQFKMSDLEFVP